MIYYFCDRCGYNTPRKSNIENHFNRKYTCLATINDVSVEVLCIKYGVKYKDHNQKLSKLTPNDSGLTPNDSGLTPNDSGLTPNDSGLDTTKSVIKAKTNDSNNKTSQCEYCKYTFTKRCNLIRHYNRCKIKSDIVKENKELKKELENLKQKNLEINTISNTDVKIGNITNNLINTNNIIIHNYGKEDLSYLTGNELTNYVKNLPPGVIKLIEKVHFNPKPPENSNLRITNKKESFIQIRRKNRWILEDKMNVISNLLTDKYELLEKHLEELEEGDLNTIDKRIIDRFRNNYSNNLGYVKEIQKKIELMIINNSNLLK